METANNRLRGKVVKIFADGVSGFIATPTRAHFFFHQGDNPKLKEMPALKTWVSFAATEGIGKHDRAVNVEVI